MIRIEFLFVIFLLQTAQSQFEPLGVSTSAQLQFGGGGGGSNLEFALYDENCALELDSTGVNAPRYCSTSKHLVCEEHRCKCEPGYIYLDHVQLRRCEPEPVATNEWSCTWDQQCQQSKLGKYSRCEEGQDSGGGRRKRCECFDMEGQSRATMRIEDVCYVNKNVGDRCENDNQCNLTITGSAYCNGVSASASGPDPRQQLSSVGICACADAYVANPSLPNECLRQKTVGEHCAYDFQCTGSLGELSACVDGACKCTDTKNMPYTEGYREARFYVPRTDGEGVRGRCHYVSAVNESCSTTEECILGFHPNAACMPHESYNGERVCRCPTGQRCELGSGSGGIAVLANAFVLILLVYRALAVII